MWFRTRRASAIAVAVALCALFLAPARAFAAPVGPAAGGPVAGGPVAGEAATPKSPLAAAAFACGSRCDYQDPQTFPASYCGQYCFRTCASDARTIDTAWHGSEYIELRYSNYCQTLWIRGNAYVSSDYVMGAALSTHPYGDYGTTYGTVYLPPGNGVRYSAMLNDAGRCGQGQIYAAGSAYDWTTCY